MTKEGSGNKNYVRFMLVTLGLFLVALTCPVIYEASSGVRKSNLMNFIVNLYSRCYNQLKRIAFLRYCVSFSI